MRCSVSSGWQRRCGGVPTASEALAHGRLARKSASERLERVSDVKKYMCLICGFIYDEAEGRPDEGIPAGTKWADIPLSWRCPDCGSGKEDFEMVEV
jgi:rubredoxin